ncbi:MAG: DEAD/DEAH box helicase family protein [Parachlamydia sp.]|nr:DEAD/DEAH box helicase family protein [Parachlamydia sp.]
MLTPSEKIALFRTLFRGRDDIYPRWYTHREKSGCSPACGNEWVVGICEKPRIKCTQCRHHRFLPVTDELILWHLSGKEDFLLSIYPMLLDETCYFSILLLNKLQDASALIKTCRQLKLNFALEDTNPGGRLWLFFEHAIPAALARKLCSHILTETMEHHPEIGFDAYDRLIPTQDTLPKWGFGTPVALPLQKRARSTGKSAFVDDSFAPYPDPWQFLSEIGKIKRQEAEDIVQRADAQERIMGVPYIQGDEMPRSAFRTILKSVPDQLELILANGIAISRNALPPNLLNRLMRLAAFQNPEFYKAQAMRLSTYGLQRIIASAELSQDHLILPRGCLEELIRLLTELRIRPVICDERRMGRALEVSFRGELRPDQLAAAEALLAHNTGILSAATAFGKTVVASWLISQRRVSTLILVHRRQLQEQWTSQLASFLDIAPGSIGRIGGGRRTATGLVDVALLQSLTRKGIEADYGQLIVDECHHLPAHSFEQIARQASSRYVTGLTATLERKDGRQPVILMQCGPVRCRMHDAVSSVSHTVFVRPTGFYPIRRLPADARLQFRQLYEELIVNEKRNSLICHDVIHCFQEGRRPIVLSERKEHVERLARLLAPHIPHLVVLCAGRQSSAILPDNRVLLATGRLIGEGFDDAQLDTLFLTLPVSWRGTIEQYVGRLHRSHSSKQEVRVYDYADFDVPMLARMFQRRRHGYEALGYTVQLPGSAAGGWPVEAPLPSDPSWNVAHASSVNRLIRDGVDLSLATLFMHATEDGADRARSGCEAFLYRRLESLPLTAGRFRLNAELSIPFDGFSRMEVDLLCQDARLAIELDGPHHFADADAYRRDRRKDALLQEQGYLVLRFLAEDIATRLDEALDSILRALLRKTCVQY